jgi:hypothetical protein
VGRITRSPLNPKPRHLYEVKVSRLGEKWPRHQAELWAVARIAGAAGYKLRRPFWAYDAVAFDTADRAAALEHWLREQRFSEGKPIPAGPPKPAPDEIASERWLALEWGFATGMAGAVAQAYRERRQEGWSHMPSNYAAAEVVCAARPELSIDQARDTADHLCRWAEDHHRAWFWRGVDKDHHFQGF